MKPSILVSSISVLVLFGGGCSSSPTVQTPTAVEISPQGQPTAVPTDDSVDQNVTSGATPETGGPSVDVKAVTDVLVDAPKVVDTKPKVETPVAAVTHAVSIQNFAFSQKTLTVKKGDKVVFTNQDSVGHTASADGGAFESGMLQQGASFTLDTSKLSPGSYPYHCAPHPSMKATLVVE